MAEGSRIRTRSPVTAATVRGRIPDISTTAARRRWRQKARFLQATDAAAQLQKVRPGFTVQTLAGMHRSDDPTFIMQSQRILEGLPKAGVPEGEKKTN
jgi:hypothetical protein